MKEFFDKILAWVKGNLILAIVILFVAGPVLFPKLLRGVFGSPRRRRRRTKAVPIRRRRRSLPRSVGMHKVRRSKPRRQYTKGGKVKKPWQIKGSEAARRHMAKIRRMR